MQRSRSWRLAQNERVMQRRRNIIRNVWNQDVPIFEDQPNRMSKFNLNCTCHMCKLYQERYDRQEAKREEFQEIHGCMSE